MSVEKKSKSTIIIWLVLAVEIILFFVFAMILHNISTDTLKIMPEQTAQVEVVWKQKQERRVGSLKYDVPKYSACFKFKDGIEKEFTIDAQAYETIQENQAGTLFYKGIYPNKDEYKRIFIRFEKTQPEQEIN